jgi:hypothetical protein
MGKTRRVPPPVAPKQRVIEISPEQTALIARQQNRIDAERRALNVLLAGILAGHGVAEGTPVLSLDTTTNRITVGAQA